MAWKPETAPQAMLMNIMGNIGRFLAFGWVFCSPSQNSGSGACRMNSFARMPIAMKRRVMAKMGYIRPMILSTGNRVAIR